MSSCVHSPTAINRSWAKTKKFAIVPVPSATEDSIFCCAKKFGIKQLAFFFIGDERQIFDSPIMLAKTDKAGEDAFVPYAMGHTAIFSENFDLLVIYTAGDFDLICGKKRILECILETTIPAGRHEFLEYANSETNKKTKKYLISIAEKYDGCNG